MKSINAYLTFDGNCQKAMTFYQKCLGGKLIFQTIDESPLGYKMPRELKDLIILATLSNENLVIMATDLANENGIIRGNTVSLMLNCTSKKEIEHCYRKLSRGGKADHPLAPTFWGAMFGDLTDKFGNHWVLNYSKNV